MIHKRTISIWLSLVSIVLVTGCSDNKAYETAMCTLADTSGTYADQKENVARVIKAGVVAQMMPGDSLYLINIDSNSYTQKNLVAKLKLGGTVFITRCWERRALKSFPCLVCKLSPGMQRGTDTRWCSRGVAFQQP